MKIHGRSAITFKYNIQVPGTNKKTMKSRSPFSTLFPRPHGPLPRGRRILPSLWCLPQTKARTNMCVKARTNMCVPVITPWTAQRCTPALVSDMSFASADPYCHLLNQVLAEGHLACPFPLLQLTMLQWLCPCKCSLTYEAVSVHIPHSSI